MNLLQLSLASAIMVGPASGGSAPADLSPAQRACAVAFTAAWRKTEQAYIERKWEEAAAAAATPKPCLGDARLEEMMALYRAEVLVRAGDFAAALRNADSVTPTITPDQSYWAISRAVRLAALQGVGDETRFFAERDALVAAHEAALMAQGRMVKRERFETPLAVVDAYELPGSKGAYRHTMFIASPRSATMPLMFEVNRTETSMLAYLMDESPASLPPFGDFNTCALHATLMLSPEELVTYEGLRERALTLFSDPATFSVPQAGDETADISPGKFCDRLRVILPAFRLAKREEGS